MKFVDASYKFKFKDRKLIQGDQAGLSYDALDVDRVKAPDKPRSWDQDKWATMIPASTEDQVVYLHEGFGLSNIHS